MILIWIKRYESMLEDSPVLFSVGIITDVQYGIRENSGSSHFEESLRFLEEAILCFNKRGVEAVINLGDLVDSNESRHLDAAKKILSESRSQVINILGNHDLMGPTKKRNVLKSLGIKKTWGERFKKANWRFIAVDSTECSILSDNFDHKDYQQILQKLKERKDPCLQEWNGMASQNQMREIKKLLEQSTVEKNNVVILNHMVTGTGSGSAAHRALNHQELIELFNSSTCVCAQFNGHDHSGGFKTDQTSGIHYLTLPAICDSGGKTSAHAIAHFSKNSITIEGWGRALSRELKCKRRDA